MRWLQVLRDKQILSVPVVSASGHFSGCFSVTDALKALIRGLKLDKQRSSLDLKPGDAGRALAKVYDSTVAQVMHDGDLWYMQVRIYKLAAPVAILSWLRVRSSACLADGSRQ